MLILVHFINLIYSLSSPKMLGTVIEVKLVLNSCRIHADFIFSLNCIMFCTVIEIRLVSNSCRIHAEFLLISFLPWIFSMNSTPLLCKVLHKTLWKFNLKMKSAWIRYEFNTNLISITVQNIVQFRLKMKSAWIRHEFNTILISITVQSIVKKSVHKSSSKHCSLFVSFLNWNSYSPTKNMALPPTPNHQHKPPVLSLLNNFKGVETTN